jgi:hypothetical protein
MKLIPCFICATLASAALAAVAPKTKATYTQVYGETTSAVSVDPAKDLPRYPAVEVKDAVATWKVKPGFKLQLAANEPQVRDPIALCFDENGRMFVLFFFLRIGNYEYIYGLNTRLFLISSA